MKKFKSLVYAVALGAATMGLCACQDDVDSPAINIPSSSLQPNTTLLELKEIYWNDATNYAETIGEREDGSHYIIHGRVISSDEDGNVFKSLIIQDETAALAFSIDSYNLYLNYRQGQEIVMDVTGMNIGKYAGLQQMGRPSWYENGSTWQVSFMSKEYFDDHAELNGLPQPALNDTIVVNSFAEIPGTNEGLRKFQSRIVRFRNVSFVEGGKTTFSVYHATTNDEQNRTLTDSNGGTMIVRTSGYCTFFNDMLPEGNIDLVGILSYYNGSWQIILNDIKGVIEVGDRPGTLDHPYTVEEAIADEEAGISASGWVKGYIVGAVAPEVESVTGNDDIEWEAPTVLASTLVIASDAATQDISKSLVVQLPSGSVFQEVANLRDNPANLGKEIMVKGNLVKFLDTYGLTGNSGKADEFKLEGVSVDTGEIPAGDGTQASPLNCSQVIAMNPSSTTASPDGGAGVWVEGYIVGYMPTGGSSTLLSGTVFAADADAATTNLVIGPTPDCTDASKCVGVQLPTSMRAELALATNPGNLGKRLAIKGDVMKYCGGPGVKNLTDKVFDGSGSTPDTPVTPPVTGGGDGTETSPFTCAQVIATNPSSTTVSPDGYTGIWVQGYIVGYMPTGGSSTLLSGTVFAADANAATTNLVIGPTADCKDASLCVGVQLPTSMRADLALANQPSNLGKLLKIKGDVMKYCGGPGVKNLTANVLEGSSAPGPGVEPTGDGTAASPYNVTKALAVASALSSTGEAAAYAKGTISSITELSTSFGNATYIITDGSASLQVYRGYWLNGDKFTSESQLAVGAEVVVSGTLVNYMGNTPQFTTGSMIVSYNGSTGGDTPTTPDTPDDPVTPPTGEDGVINHDAFTGVAGDATVTAGGYTFTFAKNAGATNPQDYTADMRLYAKNSLQIQGGRMTKIVFTLGSVTTRYTTFTPSTGTLSPAQAEGDTTITWVGDATDVTFTVGDTALYGAEAGKPGQIRFTKIEITAAE
ncbi:MAG: hypothetical protein K2I69_04815 [Muribaculaceae bacterium]|nr:hypothetical protein [Muribaculaceae bacterium]